MCNQTLSSLGMAFLTIISVMGIMYLISLTVNVIRVYTKTRLFFKKYVWENSDNIMHSNGLTINKINNDILSLQFDVKLLKNEVKNLIIESGDKQKGKKK